MQYKTFLLMAGGACLLSLMNPAWSAETVLRGNFVDAGPLDGLEVQSDRETIVWSATETLASDGTGIVTDSNGGGVGMLPIGNLLQPNSVITVTARVEIFDGDQGYMRMGFSEAAIFRNFGPFVMLMAYPEEGDGRVGVISGPITDQDRGENRVGELLWERGKACGFVLGQENLVEWSYHCETGEFTLKVNGTEALRAPILYGGTAERAPIDRLQYVGFQFQRLSPSSEQRPARVLEFEVRIGRD